LCTVNKSPTRIVENEAVAEQFAENKVFGVFGDDKTNE
jgi:myo-inositol-1-phosphate synthase